MGIGPNEVVIVNTHTGARIKVPFDQPGAVDQGITAIGSGGHREEIKAMLAQRTQGRFDPTAGRTVPRKTVPRRVPRLPGKIFRLAQVRYGAPVTRQRARWVPALNHTTTVGRLDYPGSKQALFFRMVASLVASLGRVLHHFAQLLDRRQ